MIIGAVIRHTVERNLTNKALDTKGAENFLSEAWQTISTGFPLYGEPLWEAILAGIVIVGLIILWNLVGKGQGSHAGREEVRRSYRRKLAQEMAKQDAEAIKRGEKPRRRYMQW